MSRSIALGLASLLNLVGSAAYAQAAVSPQATATRPEPDKVHPAIASSTLAPEAGHTYEATNLLDGRLDTAWCFRADSASVSLYLGEAEALRASEGFAIDLYPGYRRAPTSYVNNGAPRTFTLSLSVGGHSLSDPFSGGASAYGRGQHPIRGAFRCLGAGPCTVEVPPGRSPSKGAVVVEVSGTDVRPGLRSPDTCLSEIEARFPSSAPARVHLAPADSARFDEALARRFQAGGRGVFRVRDGAVEDEWKLPQPADPPCPAFAALKPGSSPVGSGKLTWRSGNKVVGEAPLDGEAFVSGASLRPDTIRLRFPGFEEGRPISEFRIEPTAYCPDGGGVTWSCTEARCAIASVDYRFKGALPLSWPSAPSSAFAKKEPLADDRKQLERDAQGWVEEVRRMLSAACATHPCPAGLLQVQTAIGNGAPGFEAVEPIPFATFAPESTPKPEVHTWRARFRVEQGEVDLMHSDSDPDADDGVPGDWLLILKDGQELADYHRETPWDVPFSLRLRAGQHSLEITDDTEDDPLALKSEERLPTIIRWSFR